MVASQSCLTGLASANVIGEKLPMFVIGKTKLVRCFKNIKHLPCSYRTQKKSWMDSTLFEEWDREIDWQFTKEGRKIILLVDNCSAHPIIDNLIPIELIFLPPNTISKLHSMDNCVIKSLKAHYRTLSVQKLIDSIEKKVSSGILYIGCHENA